MPVYTYRREDGTTFDYRQSFSDEALTTDPATGQKVVRVVQPARVIFKGSGFYVTDTRGASSSTSKPPSSDGSETKSDTKSDSTTETKTETKAETKTETKSKAEAPAAAD